MVVLFQLRFSVAVGKQKYWYTSKNVCVCLEKRKIFGVRNGILRVTRQDLFKPIKPGLSREREQVGSPTVHQV